MDSQYIFRTPFVSPKGRGMITVALLYMSIGASVLSIFLGFYLTVFQPEGAYIEGIDQADVGMGTFILGIQGLTLVSKLPLVILTAIFFLIWLYRVTKNVEAFGAVPEYSPALAVGCWFIPFANLVMPCKAVNDAWEKSEPFIKEKTEYWHKSSAAWLFIGWWGCWIISRILSRVADVYAEKVETTDQWFILTKIIMVFDIFSIISAFCCIMIILGINKRQEARYKYLSDSAESNPPAPPVFHQIPS